MVATYIKPLPYFCIALLTNIPLPDYCVHCCRNGIELPEIIAFGSLVVSAGGLVATAIIAFKGFATMDTMKKDDVLARETGDSLTGRTRLPNFWWEPLWS
jgi:hypothetical protein